MRNLNISGGRCEQPSAQDELDRIKIKIREAREHYRRKRRNNRLDVAYEMFFDWHRERGE